MELYLVRHGIAEDTDPMGVRSDAERALTPEGVKKADEAARGLRALNVRPDRIGSSPMVRAKETADVLARVLCPKVTIEECAFLAEGAETEKAVDWLRESPVDSAMLVGHMPQIAELASELLGKGAQVRMVFKRSTVCCISFEGSPGPGKGRLEWLLQPRHLRRLA